MAPFLYTYKAASQCSRVGVEDKERSRSAKQNNQLIIEPDSACACVCVQWDRNGGSGCGQQFTRWEIRESGCTSIYNGKYSS